MARTTDPGGDHYERVISFYEHRAHRYGASRKRGFMAWLERRDLEALWTLLEPAAGQSALDVGCGLGVHARALSRAGLHVTAVDVAPNTVALVRPDVEEALVGDVERLDLGRRFDRVLCFGVLDYVANPERCVENLALHVAPGGRLVIEVPRRSAAGYVYAAAYRLIHGIRVNLFSTSDLAAAAARRGLRCVATRRPFVHNLFAAFAPVTSAQDRAQPSVEWTPPP